MRECIVLQKGIRAGHLIEHEQNRRYEFKYLSDYRDFPVSLTLPIKEESYWFDTFPPFFDGLLPEGHQLDALLRRLKIDRDDPFSQLVAIGSDTVGSVTVEDV